VITLIKARNLSISFNGKTVFKSFEFSLREKQFLVVIGPNGSGKTTLGLLLAGLIPEFIKAEIYGTYTISGKTGMLMQNPSPQFFALTVKEEIGAALPQGVGIEELWEKSVFELSEGEKQRVNLIANLCNGMDTLILDEPLELLDPFQANRFLKIIKSFKGKKTILWLDKDQGFVESEGKIFLGKSLQKFPKRRKHSIGKKLLQAEFSIKREGFESNNINLKLYEGEKVALIGLNGSGKTTLLKAIAGLVPIKGIVELQSNFSFSPQNPDHIFFENSVQQEIGSMQRMRFFGLQQLAKNFPERLSKGQKKLLSLASLQQGQLYLLDEPTTWLDVENKATVYNWINNSREAFLVATHDRKLLDYCDRVLLIEGGELKECSSTTVKRFFRAGL